MVADDRPGEGPSSTPDASSAADPSATDPDAESRDRPDGADEAPEVVATGGRRDVVVPLSLYKVVTVFSTLIAVVLVVGGMVALDVATGRGTVEPDEISLPTAAAGVVAIVLGAAVYAFSTRFRAEGMGNPKDDTDEPSDDG